MRRIGTRAKRPSASVNRAISGVDGLDQYRRGVAFPFIRCINRTELIDRVANPSPWPWDPLTTRSRLQELLETQRQAEELQVQS